MKFRTIVEFVVPNVSVRPEHRLTLLGSCFAEHIGDCMARSGLDVHVNPHGVLYNPLSLSAACRSWVLESKLPDGYFFESGGMWHCWLNDSSFSADSLEDCRTRLEKIRSVEAVRLRSLDYLFLTLGTNRCYELKDGGLVVGNCHKQPERLFVERQMDVAEVVAVLGQTLEQLWEVRPSLQVVFTVSPYRYAKYGYHGNQLGKSVLLLAVDELCHRYEGRCHYFPAYEIVLDELRDYRFYADDMLHPSDTAVSYIWERFSEACLASETRVFIKEWEVVEKALTHRPRRPDSDVYRDFMRQTMLKLERLVGKYPNLAFTPEYERLIGLLNS